MSKFSKRSCTYSGSVCVWPSSAPGDDAHRAELAKRAGGREHDAVDDAPADRGQRDLAKRSAKQLAPSVAAACSASVPSSCSTGTVSRATNGSETNAVASTMPGTEKITCDAVRGQPVPKPAGAAIDEHEREPHDDRGDRKGQVHDQPEQPAPRKRPRSINSAMPMPNTVFSGTTIATSSTDSQKACIALGWVTAFQTGARPCSKVL